MLRTIIVTIYTMVASATIIAKISFISLSVIVAVVPAIPIEPLVIKSFIVFISITLALIFISVSNYCSSGNMTSSQPPSGIGIVPSCNPYSPPDVAYPCFTSPIVLYVSIISSLGYLYLYLVIACSG